MIKFNVTQDNILNFIYKTLIAIMAVIGVCSILCVIVGCSSKESDNGKVMGQFVHTEDADFIFSDAPNISDTGTITQVITDIETGVEYLYVSDTFEEGSGCAVTPLYNQDGSLKISKNHQTEDEDKMIDKKPTEMDVSNFDTTPVMSYNELCFNINDKFIKFYQEHPETFMEIFKDYSTNEVNKVLI